MTQNSTDCLFCKIVAKTVPAEIINESEQTLVFKDIRPQAPIHLLIIPKQHIATLNEITPTEKSLLGEMYLIAIELARKNDISDSGYRTVFNCNTAGGQEVFHLHLHLLGGRNMAWPPG